MSTRCRKSQRPHELLGVKGWAKQPAIPTLRWICLLQDLNVETKKLERLSQHVKQVLRASLHASSQEARAQPWLFLT